MIENHLNGNHVSTLIKILRPLVIAMIEATATIEELTITMKDVVPDPPNAAASDADPDPVIGVMIDDLTVMRKDLDLPIGTGHRILPLGMEESPFQSMRLSKINVMKSWMKEFRILAISKIA